MSQGRGSSRWQLEREVWYYASEAAAEGPLERDELLGLLARGEIARSTPVWRPGMDDWTPARKVEVLAEMLPPPVEPEGPPSPPTAEAAGGRPEPRASLPALPDAGPGDDESAASDPKSPGSGWMPAAAGAAIVLVGGLAAWALGGGTDAGSGSDGPAARGASAAADSAAGRRAVLADHRRALADSLSRLPRGDSLRRALQTEGLVWTRRLAFAGLRRLPDRVLVDHAELMGEALAAVPRDVCAAVARWTAGEDEYRQLLAGLDPERAARLLEVFRAGVMAELRDRSPWPRPEADAVTAAFAMLEDRLPESAADSLRRALAPGAAPAPEEACWAERSLYGGVPRLPDPWRAVLARAVVTG